MMMMMMMMMMMNILIPAVRPTQLLIQRVTGFFPELRWPGLEVKNSSTSGAEVNE
jgi:hypothetical protein